MNGRASGPVLTSGCMVVLDHSAPGKVLGCEKGEGEESHFDDRIVIM